MSNTRVRRIVLWTATWLALTAGAASAEDFVVTNLSDSEPGSLRAAVEQANSSGGPDRVVFGSGGRGVINLESQLSVTDALEIDGAGAGTVTLDGGFDSRVISAADTSLDLTGLTIRHGGAPSGAGILAVNTDLTLADSIVTGNAASGGSAIGGGILATFGGSLSIVRGTVARNDARLGGGVFAQNVPVQVASSTFTGNRALGTESYGGALFAADIPPEDDPVPPGFDTSVPVEVSNSTFANNTSERVGGAFAGHGFLGESTLRLRSSTVSGNTANVAGGGVAGGFLEVELANSLIHGNAAPSGADISSVPPFGTDTPDAPVTAFDSRFSLIGSTSGGEFNDVLPGSNLIGVDPLLIPLADNGGPTRTMALAEASPVIDQGSSDLGEDQRGEVRPFEQAGVPNPAAPGADGSDMGAFEVSGQVPPRPVGPTGPTSPTGPTGPTGPNGPVIDPSNRFVFKRLIRKPRRGTAIQRIRVPGPGRLVLLKSNKVRRMSVRANRAGGIGLRVRTKRRAKRKLLTTGKVRLKIRVRYVPDGGKPATRARTVLLVKRLSAS